MNFLQRRRRTPVLQIIPLIDILIVLLIFLVVSTNFKDPEAKKSILKITTPTSESLALGEDVDARISLSVDKDAKMYVDDREIAPGQLADALKELKAAKPKAKLNLAVDAAAPFEGFLRAGDALTQAGYDIKDVPTKVSRPR